MARQVDLSLVANYTMSRGIGDLQANKACVVAQAAILDAISRGEEIHSLTDELDCACPVLRVLAIALNDIKWWTNDEERTETLRPLLSLLLDSRREPSITAQRAVRASIFAEYAAEHAAKYAKYAAEYAAKHAKYAAEHAAKYAAKYAVEYAAKYAAKYAAEYAAKYAAKYAAEHAVEYAAKYAEYAAEHAVEYAVEYAKSLGLLRDELLKTWLECEAMQ